MNPWRDIHFCKSGLEHEVALKHAFMTREILTIKLKLASVVFAFFIFHRNIIIITKACLAVHSSTELFACKVNSCQLTRVGVLLLFLRCRRLFFRDISGSNTSRKRYSSFYLAHWCKRENDNSKKRIVPFTLFDFNNKKWIIALGNLKQSVDKIFPDLCRSFGDHQFIKRDWNLNLRRLLFNALKINQT